MSLRSRWNYKNARFNSIEHPDYSYIITNRNTFGYVNLLNYINHLFYSSNTERLNKNFINPYCNKSVQKDEDMIAIYLHTPACLNIELYSRLYWVIPVVDNERL